MNKRRITRGMILVGSAVALVATPLWIVAQQQPPTPPAAAIAPALTPPVSQPVAATTQVEIPTTGPVAMLPKNNHVATTQISVRFKDAPIDSVLQYLSQAAGYAVIKESPIDLRVTMWKDQPMPPEEAVSMLNTLLLPSGYTAVVQGVQGKVLKITSREKAKKGSIPVFVGVDPNAIPLTDDLRTQVIPLKSVDAIKLKVDLQPLVGTDADLTCNAASNSLMITDTAANIHRVVEIVASLDKTQAMENDIIVQRLNFADATSTAKLIMDIFQPPASQQANLLQGPLARFFGRGGPGGPGGANNPQEEKGRTGTVTASSDMRTNTIVVTGPKETLAEIKVQIIDKIDNDPSVNQAFFTYHVKNGQAIDMQATVNSLFGGSVGNTNRTNTTSARSGSTGGIGLGSSSGSGGLGGGSRGSSAGGLGNRTGTTTANNTGRTGTGGGAGYANPGGAAGGLGSSSSGTGTLMGSLVGQVQVVADTDTNTLLVLTATKYKDQVEDIIKELDRPVPQVLIKCLIAEVTHDRSDDLGVDFSILNLSKGLSGGSNMKNAAASIANGGLAVTLVESQIAATFHALAVAGKLDVLSRPYILTSDNQQANIVVGQYVPFVTNVRFDASGNQIITPNYQNIGIILDVTPHINSDGLVVMDVNPEISSLSASSINLGGPTNPVNAPVFNTRSASSRVGVRDGDTIVIGGLMQDQKTQTVHKVPILGDIPWLGLLFQRDQVTKTKTELLIFLTPHVAQAPSNLQPMSVDEMKGVHLTPGAVQPGMFQEHINGLRLGGSTTQPVLPIPKAEQDRNAWEPEPKMP